ncbi:MAG: AAA family ATPase [Prevotella sp.]|nr:AAA family ATPase [Prevotella sp.]
MTRRYAEEIILKKPVDKNSYLAGLPIVRFLEKNRSIPINADVTFLVGENGTGKSTLIEAIAISCGFNPEGGTKNFCFSTSGDGDDFHSELWEHITVARSRYPKDGFFLRAESYFNLATHIDELDRLPGASPPIIAGYGGVSLHKQSHGESFLALVQNRFFGNGLYILDEPEAALSPMRLMTLIAEIDRLVKRDSQFIIATHSPILLAFPGAAVMQLSESGIEQVGYRDTEHYRVTRRFLENPEKMMRYLTGED